MNPCVLFLVALPLADAARWVRGNTIISPKVSPIQIEVDRQLPHIGVVTFQLKKVAEVERFVFARSDGDGRVRTSVGLFSFAQAAAANPGAEAEHTP